MLLKPEILWKIEKFFYCQKWGANGFIFNFNETRGDFLHWSWYYSLSYKLCIEFDNSRFGRKVNMKPTQARKLRDILLIVGIVVMLMGYLHEAFFIAGACISCSCLTPHFLFYKCPHCGKLLGRNEGAFCQHCGKRIDD